MSTRNRTLVTAAFAALATTAAVPAIATAHSPGTRERVRASIRVVPTRYATIQAAVNAARPGDTVRIRPGGYSEQVSIAKDVTIVGAGARHTTIRSPGTLAPGSLGKASIIDVHAGATVSVSRLTVSGPGPNACAGGSLHAGIKVVQDATLDLHHARVLDIHDTPIHDCAHNGDAIAIGDFPQQEVGHATIHHVEIRQYQSAGITVFTPGSTATITDNRLDAQVDPSTVVFTGGIEIANGAVAKVTHNRITGNRCSSPELECGPDPITQFQAAGLANGPGALPGPGTEFADNTIIDNDIGIYLFAADNCCTVHDNHILDNTLFGIAIQDGINDLAHDMIRGGAVGVGVIADFMDATATLHRERIFATSNANTVTIQCCGFTATIVDRQARSTEPYGMPRSRLRRSADPRSARRVVPDATHSPPAVGLGLAPKQAKQTTAARRFRGRAQPRGAETRPGCSGRVPSDLLPESRALMCQ